MDGGALDVLDEEDLGFEVLEESELLVVHLLEEGVVVLPLVFVAESVVVLEDLETDEEDAVGEVVVVLDLVEGAELVEQVGDLEGDLLEVEEGEERLGNHESAQVVLVVGALDEERLHLVDLGQVDAGLLVLLDDSVHVGVDGDELVR